MKTLYAITAIITMLIAILATNVNLQIAALTVCLFNWVSYWGTELKEAIYSSKGRW